MRRTVATLALIVMLGTAAGSGATAASEVVLGSKTLFSGGSGWGTAHPHRIFNGGDPNGTAWNLHWTRWGSATAHATGLTWIFRPNGGYFSKPGRIELSASGIARCTAGGPQAYIHLRARESVSPSGRFGPWFQWSGLRTLCRRT